MATQEIQRTREREYDRLGGAALQGAGIEFSELGVNDYATHLDQYLKYGEAAIESIEEDLITDSAERMVKSKYIHEVSFARHDDDFLSKKGNFSMRKMTSNTENRMAANQADWLLQKRAEIESREVDKLNGWFNGARENEVFVVDSLPIAENEEYAVKRIYQKIDGQNLSMHVIILHSPSTGAFNDYHQEIGANIPPSVNALGMLENPYVLEIPEGIDIDEFIRSDVDAYDRTLTKHNPGQEFVFGIPEEKRKEMPNSNDVIRRQKPLLGIYKDAIRALAQSDWRATPEIIGIDRRLKLDLFAEGQSLSLDDSRSLLDGVHQYIMATLNDAPDATLDMLAALHGQDPSAVYDVASHYGIDARDRGTRYESSACPTVPGSASTSEQAAAEKAYRLNKDPTKCVLCPGCKSVVDLPKDLYKKNILHCTECKLTVKGGKVINHREVFKNLEDETFSSFDIITNWFKNEQREEQIRKAAMQQAKAELGDDVTYMDKKRYEKQVRESIKSQAA